MAKHKGYTWHKAGRASKSSTEAFASAKIHPKKLLYYTCVSAHLLPVGQGAKPQAYGVLRTFSWGNSLPQTPWSIFLKPASPAKPTAQKPKLTVFKKTESR